MSKLLWFLCGMLCLCVIAILAGVVFVTQAHGFSASQPPTAVEAWAARWARSAALPGNAKSLANPVPNTPEVLADARAHWADHCAVCHANDGSGDTVMGKHMYPPAPDMRQAETQRMSDGELFSIIQNGVRMTGMPAWGAGGSDHDAEDSWKLVHFIRHLPDLTFEEKKEMEKLNPKGPEDRKEEEEEEKFLKGEDTNEPQPEHHHH